MYVTSLYRCPTQPYWRNLGKYYLDMVSDYGEIPMVMDHDYYDRRYEWACARFNITEVNADWISFAEHGDMVAFQLTWA